MFSCFSGFLILSSWNSSQFWIRKIPKTSLSRKQWPKQRKESRPENVSENEKNYRLKTRHVGPEREVSSSVSPNMKDLWDECSTLVPLPSHSRPTLFPGSVPRIQERTRQLEKWKTCEYQSSDGQSAGSPKAVRPSLSLVTS